MNKPYNPGRPKKPKNGEVSIMPVPGVIGPMPPNKGKTKGKGGYKSVKMYPTPVTKKRKK